MTIFNNENLIALIFKQLRLIERFNFSAKLNNEQFLNIIIPFKLRMREQQKLEGHTNNITCLINHTDGEIVSASEHTICVWELNNIGNYTLKHVLTEHTQKVTSLISLPNGNLASGSYDKTIRIWNGKECIETIQQEAIINSMILTPDGYMIVARYGHLVVLDPENRFKQVNEIQIYSLINIQLLLLSDGKSFASVWSNDYIMIHGLYPTIQRIRYVLDNDHVCCILQLPDGNIVAGGKKRIKVYDINLICVKVIEDQ
jgi:WD40 repeat protein